MNNSISAIRRSTTFAAIFSIALTLAGGGGSAQAQKTARAAKPEIAAEKTVEPAARVSGKPCFDFFGTGRTSFATARGSGGGIVWDLRNNGGAGATTVNFGLISDFVTPGYYDADNIADIAVYRADPATLTGTYFVRPSTAPTTFYGQQWGRSNGDLNDPNNDFPGVEGDYDGDGRDDVTIVRIIAPSNNFAWYYLRSSDNTFRAVEFGNAGSNTSAVSDLPLPGADYNGDGRDDLTVVRDNGGTITDQVISGDSVTSQIVASTQWGRYETDFYVVGDYVGDSRADYVVWRGTSGGDAVWYIKENGGNSVTSYKWGLSGVFPNRDTPVCGDYNGDGKSDVAVFRGSNATFYWIDSNSATGGNPPTVGIRQSGQVNDLPLGSLKTL